MLGKKHKSQDILNFINVYPKLLVLKGGLEPPCPKGHMNLNHACLPFHHFSAGSKYQDGGVDRVRTDDPHNAIVMLFQLSYNPIGWYNQIKKYLICQ